VTDHRSARPPSDEFDVHCVSAGLAELTPEKRRIVCERPLTIEVRDVGTYTIMCTPGDEIALALGFALSEGLIDSRDDVSILTRCPDNPQLIRMELASPPEDGDSSRNMLVVSSCGMCGAQDLDAKIGSLPVLEPSYHIAASQLAQLPEALRERQGLFRATGGSHAAGIVSRGEFIAVCEDLGRHTALDKAIGTCLLQRLATRGTAVVLSGRVSFEMVAKAARAGIELIAAVSAPTSLALEAAAQSNITLCGFVRGGHATVYTHPQRICPDGHPEQLCVAARTAS
jgi:FdhD protein